MLLLFAKTFGDVPFCTLLCVVRETSLKATGLMFSVHNDTFLNRYIFITSSYNERLPTTHDRNLFQHYTYSHSCLESQTPPSIVLTA